MPDKIMAILAEVTGGKSYKAHKYGLDHADRPFIDYGEDSIIWKKTAETDKSNRKYVPLEVLSKTLSAREEQRLTYFLDGSRRVFKVDDIAYTKSGGRSAIYPVVAGQIGVGCCKRENKRLIPEKFKREFVLSIPDIANADGKAGFFPATARKLNESPELKRLGIEINQVNAAQFENYANDKQAITIAMDSLIDELPNALSAEDLSMYKLVTQARDILNIVTEGLPEETFISSEASDMSQYEAIMRDNQSAPVVKKHFNIAELFESLNSVSGESQDIYTTQKINNAPATDTILLQENETKSNTIGFLLSDKQIEELNEQVRMLLPNVQENNISLYSEDSSVVGILNDIKSMLENTPANADTLRHLFSGEAFKLMLKEALEQQWMIKPGDLEKNPKKLDGLYDKIEKQITNMETILKTSGVVNPKAEALADNIRGNIEFMNQINEAYTYVQVPLKMNEKNASGQLYVYTNKKSMSNPDKELSAFLHLDLEHLGGTDVSIKMLHRKVTTNFYLDSDESYALVKQFLPVLEKRLQDKGYNCELNVNSGSKQMNFVAGFLKKDLPPTGQVHRYSFDIRA